MASLESLLSLSSLSSLSKLKYSIFVSARISIERIFLKRLVVKQRATRFHAIADFDIQLGCDAGELVGHYVKDLRPPYATQRLSRLSLKRNVQSTFQFDCLHVVNYFDFV